VRATSGAAGQRRLHRRLRTPHVFRSSAPARGRGSGARPPRATRLLQAYKLEFWDASRPWLRGDGYPTGRATWISSPSTRTL
jgi:hypothetical protein